MLTPKQEKFVQEFIATGNATEAYRRAFPGSQKWKPESVYSKASNLLHLAKVSARVEELRKQAVTSAVATRTEALEILTNIARYAEEDRDRIAAVGKLARFEGWEQPKKVEHSGKGISFQIDLGGQGAKQ